MAMQTPTNSEVIARGDIQLYVQFHYHRPFWRIGCHRRRTQHLQTYAYV